MNIVVCVKHVPDSETDIKIAPDGVSIDESTAKFDINPYDEYALEAGVQLREKHGGEVVALLLGDDKASKTARKCLAAGADRAIHLCIDNSRMLESSVVAKLLTSEIKDHEFDIVLCGKKSIDSESHQVGVFLGEMLDVPVLTTVESLVVSDNIVTVTRDMEGGKETLECNLPCVLTAEKGLNKPRYPSLRDIMAAKKKQIERKDAASLNGSIEIIELRYPPDRPPGRIIGEGVEAVKETVSLLKNEAKVI